jgi:hypothetical protein
VLESARFVAFVGEPHRLDGQTPLRAHVCADAYIADDSRECRHDTSRRLPMSLIKSRTFTLQGLLSDRRIKAFSSSACNRSIFIAFLQLWHHREALFSESYRSAHKTSV